MKTTVLCLVLAIVGDARCAADPSHPELTPVAKRWQRVASGMVGATYETDYPDDDIEAVPRYIRRNGAELGMDSQRIALFGCSGNTMTALGALAAKNADYAASLRCAVIFYPVISHFMNKGDETMPAPFKRQLRNDPPIFMSTIGNDRPEWKEAVSTFPAGVKALGYPLEVARYEKGVHGFDTGEDSGNRGLSSPTPSPS